MSIKTSTPSAAWAAAEAEGLRIRRLTFQRLFDSGRPIGFRSHTGQRDTGERDLAILDAQSDRHTDDRESRRGLYQGPIGRRDPVLLGGNLDLSENLTVFE